LGFFAAPKWQSQGKLAQTATRKDDATSRCSVLDAAPVLHPHTRRIAQTPLVHTRRIAHTTTFVTAEVVTAAVPITLA
jgi:hypothetical protein